MGEGIDIYGTRIHRRQRSVWGNPKSIQAFADRVIADGKPRARAFHLGRLNNEVKRDMARHGVKLQSNDVLILDSTILKYRDHPKKAKGATIAQNRMAKIQSAISKPLHIYIYQDTHRDTLVYVISTGYNPNNSQVLKVVVQPNYTHRGKVFNAVTSIGVVESRAMNHPQYKKIK